MKELSCVEYGLMSLSLFDVYEVDFMLESLYAYSLTICTYFLSVFFVRFYYRAMHFSAKRSIAIACRPSVRPSVCLSVCPSVCNVGGSGPHRLEILETNCTNN